MPFEWRGLSLFWGRLEKVAALTPNISFLYLKYYDVKYSLFNLFRSGGIICVNPAETKRHFIELIPVSNFQFVGLFSWLFGSEWIIEFTGKV